MAGLMDFLNGGMFGGTDAYGSLLTDEMKKKMQQQGMMTMAAKLMAAGGPSRTPVSLGQAFGNAYLAGQEAYGQAGQNALTQLLTKQKIDEYQRDKQLKEQARQFLMGNQPAAATVPSAGGLQGVVGQVTPQGAIMRPGAAPAMPSAGGAGQVNQNAALAERLRQLATIFAPLDEAKANAYLTMADKISPQVKPVGQPFEVRNPQDQTSNILVQNYSDGTIKPVQGYSPAGMTDYQRQQLAISSANLGISQEQLARGEYTLQQTADGFAYVPKKPGMPVIPVTAAGQVPAVSGQPGQPNVSDQPAPAAPAPAATAAQLKPAGAKPTEKQAQAMGFARRMERSDAIIRSLEGNQPGIGVSIAESLPLVGGIAGRLAMSPQQQQYRQAGLDWVRSKLRFESGAVIGDQEAADEYGNYFPMPGDSQQVINQKRLARQIANDAMKKAAGEFYEPWKPSEGDAQMLQSNKSPSNPVGKLKWDPQRGWVTE